MATDARTKLEFAVLTGSLTGLIAIFLVLALAHPVFFRPGGPIRGVIYVSPNYTISDGETIKDVFSYTGPSSSYAVQFVLQPLEVRKPGYVSIRVNGIPLYKRYINSTEVTGLKIASCCAVAMVTAGTYNTVEIKSDGFEGTVRFYVEIP